MPKPQTFPNVEHDLDTIEGALSWALDQCRQFRLLSPTPPDHPYWNDYRRAEAILHGLDPEAA